MSHKEPIYYAGVYTVRQTNRDATILSRASMIRKQRTTRPNVDCTADCAVEWRVYTAPTDRSTRGKRRAISFTAVCKQSHEHQLHYVNCWPNGSARVLWPRLDQQVPDCRPYVMPVGRLSVSAPPHRTANCFRCFNIKLTRCRGTCVSIQTFIAILSIVKSWKLKRSATRPFDMS